MTLAFIILLIRLHTLEFSISPLLGTKTSDAILQQLSFNYITFIDVRKSRGRHIKRQFEILCGDACNATFSSRLSQQTKGYIHVKSPIPLDAMEQADAYLYNVRHPVDRILAWYQYEHPSRCNYSTTGGHKACSTIEDIQEYPDGNAALCYNSCFPTSNLLPLAFTNSTRVSHECKHFAHRLVQNQVSGPGFSHVPFGFNLQYYTRKTIDIHPAKSVLVVRSESIWNDLQDLEIQLGGNRKAFVPVHDEDDEDDVVVDAATNYAPLCCAVWNEMQTYRRLLKLAVNLNSKEKVDTLLHAVHHCRFSSWVDMEQQCSTLQAPIPFQHIMLVDIRKSKGSTVRKNFQAFCKAKPSQCSQPPLASVLSQSLTGYMHGKGDPPFNVIHNADSYLFNLRHPVDRLLALYHYDDPTYRQKDGSKGQLARYCFDSDKTLNENCTRVAYRLSQSDSEHNTRDFKKLEYYVNVTMDVYPNKPILVTRAESLWQDLVDLDKWLGGNGIIGEQKQNSLPVSLRDKDDDTADYASICCAMQDEVHTYRRVLERAVNLKSKERAATIEQAAKHCGFSSWSEMENRCKAHATAALAKGQPSQDVPSQPSTLSPLTNIVFVHVGKAGGQTLRALFKVFCESDRKHIPDECANAPDSVLSNKTIGYIHPKEVRPEGSIEASNVFLYNLRHPVDRMISWYYYEHPQSCLDTPETRLACRAAQEVDRKPNGDTARFFVKCFPTIDLISQAFNHSTMSSLSLDCVKLAHDVLEGKVNNRGFKHIFYNMHYYTNLTLDQHLENKVLVVRIESLWQDFKDLDVMLGGNGNFGAIEGTHDSHGSETYKKNVTKLSMDQYSLLCCALSEEMDIYRNLMKLAVNLNESEKETTVGNAAKQCGFPSWKEMEKHCGKARI